MIQVIPGGFDSTLSTSQTQYHPIFQESALTAVETSSTSLCARAGIFRNLVVHLETDPAGTGSRQFVLRVNGSDSALTCTVSSGSTTARLTGTDVSVSAGDRIALKCTTVNTPAASRMHFTLEFEPTSGDVSIYGGTWLLNQLNGTRCTNLLRAGNSNDSATSPTVQNTAIVSCAGSFTAMYGRWTSTPSAGVGGTLAIILNGVVQDGSGGTVDTRLSMVAVLSNNVGFTLPVVAGDEVSLQVIMNAAGAFNQNLQIGVAFTATTTGQSIYQGGSGSLNSNVAVQYQWWEKTINPWGGTEDFSRQSHGGVTTFQLVGLRVRMATAPGGSASRTFDVRQNGASPGGAPSVVLSAAEVVDSGSGSITVVDGDTYGLRMTPASTPASSSFNTWSTILQTGSPPVGVPDEYETPFNTTLVVDDVDGVLANDINADTATLDTGPSHGTLTAFNADGSFEYEPDLNYIGEDTFTYIPSNDFGDGDPTLVTITVLDPNPPDPGGEVGPGYPPEIADVPVGVMRRFFVLTKFFNNLMQGAADTDFFHDPSTWFGGYKPAEIISISRMDRELPRDGTFRGTEVRVLLNDMNRRWRTLADQEAISTAYGAVYVVSDTVRYALGEPFRLFGGVVVNHQALENLQYEIILRDKLSEQIAYLDETPRVPPDVLTEERLPGMYDRSEGRSAPLLVGAVSDEGTVGSPGDEQGVVPPLIVAGINLSYFGGINRPVIACLFTTGAWVQNSTWRLFYNPPDTPSHRILVPNSAFGVNVWAPGKPGWSDTGLANDYVDYPLPLSADTRRYTPVFFDATDPLAQPYLDGAVQIAGNVYGIAEVADGSGRYISDPSRAWQWLLVNQLFVPYTTGDYAEMPTLDGQYEIIDSASVERTRTRQHLRRTVIDGDDLSGYPIGFMVGRNGQQVTMRHLLQELCLGTDMQQGINRHGQLMIDTEDALEDPVARLSDLLDILTGDLAITVDREWFFNRIERYHGFRYLPPTAPNPTRAEGEPVPTHITEYNPWESGVILESHTDSIAANRDFIKTYKWENYVVRDNDVASNIATRLLTRAVGPAPGYDGPRLFKLTGPLQRLLVLELGDNFLIDHVDGYGTAGYEGALARVMKISQDTDTWRTVVSGYILAATTGSP